ncbi:MAG: Hsp33 family molecular chaperone HslO [Candidatus Izimaplasma sp.]|nr:Hsp33 family molecular chaperone HslO [Candidatus Izimaplasma bacterium]
MNDYLKKAYAFDGTVRIYAANTTNLVEEAREIHDLWPTSTSALGRLLTVSVIMGAMYKGEQQLTIRVESDGPIKGMITTTNPHGEVRGQIGNPHIFLDYNDKTLKVGQAVGNGSIHVTKDLKVRDMFTSTAQIQTGEIAEDFAYYFTKSEQIPSAVGLGIQVDEDNSVNAAGGFILQIMPGCTEETIKLIEQRLNEIPKVSEMLKDKKTPEEMINLITQGNHKFLEEMPLNYKCNCSKEKFESSLLTLGVRELEELLEEDGRIETTCHFCNTNYQFNKEEIKNLIELAKDNTTTDKKETS